MARKTAAEADGVAVIGLGRFGLALARELVAENVEVLGIDRREELVEEVAPELTHVVEADATDEATLRELGVAEMGRVVVAMSDLECSILVCTAVMELGVPTVWAKVASRRHADILLKLGVSHVVFPEDDMGKRVAHLVRGRMLDYIELDDGYAFVKTRPPRNVCDVKLSEGGFRSKYGITVVGVKRPHDDFTYADADTVISVDDIIIVSGTRSAVEKFADHSNQSA
ncbi:TrkA family potassium uptake protein [Nocardioidaceae bacterium]|nr:TrkA family potassium uptake protein [Nocardioidaceae bacterium]